MNAVDTILMEEFNLDPLHIFESDPYTGYFEDGTEYINEVIQEATTGKSSKSGIFAKIWNVIKKILAWLKKTWNKFIQFIKSLFKKKKKTADQIVEETLGEKAKHATSATGTQKNQQGDSKSAASGSKGNSTGEKTVTIEFSPEVKADKNEKKTDADKNDKVKKHLDKITLAYKDLSAKIEGDQVIFDFDVESKAKKNVPDAFDTNVAIPGQYKDSSTENNAYRNGVIAIYFYIKHPEELKKLTDVIKLLQDKTYQGTEEQIEKFVDQVNEMLKMYSINPDNYDSFYQSNVGLNRFALAMHEREKDLKKDGPISLTIKQIMEFNSILTELNKAFESYDNPSTVPGGSDPRIINVLNFISKVMYFLQCGMNVITSSMNSIHLIDAKYIGIIDNIEDLSKFIKGCIDANVPSNYVAFNAWAICNEKMRGTSSQMRPKMGQSRVVFFPYEKDVIKIALNQWGVRANKSEVAIYNAFKKHHDEKILAAITATSSNQYVVKAERADTDFDRSDWNYHRSEVKKEMIGRLKQCALNSGIDIDIASDKFIDNENIGMRITSKPKDGSWHSGRPEWIFINYARFKKKTYHVDNT